MTSRELTLTSTHPLNRCVIAVHFGCISGAFRVHFGCISGAFRVHLTRSFVVPVLLLVGTNSAAHRGVRAHLAPKATVLPRKGWGPSHASSRRIR
jgi:hypothetical protein